MKKSYLFPQTLSQDSCFFSKGLCSGTTLQVEDVNIETPDPFDIPN